MRHKTGGMPVQFSRVFNEPRAGRREGNLGWSALSGKMETRENSATRHMRGQQRSVGRERDQMLIFCGGLGCEPVVQPA